MDLQDQLKNLFPDHQIKEEPVKEQSNVWLQDEPLLCKYEKRKGKPITIIDGYNGAIRIGCHNLSHLKSLLDGGGFHGLV